MTASPEAPAAAPTTARAPKYRYFTTAPESIRLPVSAIFPAIPTNSWRGSDADLSREISLPCAELFSSNRPRINLARLGELLPGCIELNPDAPEWIPLPAGPLARAYQPVTSRELLVDPEPAAPAPAAPTEKSTTPAPATPPASPAGEPASSSAAPAVPFEGQRIVSIDKPVASWRRVLKPILGPSAEELEERHLAFRNGGKSPAVESTPSSGSPADPPAAATSPAETTVTVPPIVAPPEPPAPPRIPVADRPIANPSDLAELQSLLMTEDDLTIQRVLALSAALPGVRGCRLTADEEALSTGTVAGGLDGSAFLQSARALLNTTEAPALTLFTVTGPVSLLVHGRAALTVLHHDRGFLPGVREKLTTILAAVERNLGEPPEPRASS